MINALHLIWIIPLAAMIGATVGVFALAIVSINKCDTSEWDGNEKL